ncbi:ABCA5 protein, partial [Brachypteracias leptosomus]|nr:ABCA5 protein [Brachypteracias leptosomus]
MCSAEIGNCFPVLMNILSNTLLRLLNSTARIHIWSEPFLSTQRPEIKANIFYFCLSYMLILTAGLPPQFAMSSTEDYKVKS